MRPTNARVECGGTQQRKARTTRPQPTAAPSASEFSGQMDGYLHGILHWDDLDALWLRVRAEPHGWYASQVGEAVPASPLDAQALKLFVAEVHALLRREHVHDYCGIVYADDPERPAFIKIFDPANIGSFCGCSDEPILPRWVLSRSQPGPIGDDAPAPSARRGWWSRLFGPSQS